MPTKHLLQVTIDKRPLNDQDVTFDQVLRAATVRPPLPRIAALSAPYN